MKTRVAINGFGRIGRMVFRNAILNDEIEVVAVNASYAPEILTHLIKYDTTHGRFNGTVEATDKELIVNGKIVKLTNSRDPKLLPWKEMGIDIVIEATGKFNNKEKAIGHIEAGAKKVLITAPATNEDITIVMGVNEELFDVEKHHIVSNASCTTNCLAPLAKVLDQTFGIENGLMTTVHGYTNDQNNIDNPHKDLRRARACAQNIIPTSTGAAKALSLVLPQLKGKIHGMCLRVPTVNVSLVDLVVDLKRSVTVEEVNAAFTEAANGPMKGILDITMEPLVSTDFMTDSHSSVIDGLSTMMIGDRKIKVLSWYDNEWGYSNRVVDLALYMGKKMVENNKQTVMSN